MLKTEQKSFSAVGITGPGRMETLDRELRTPRPDELLIAPAAVGICATDIELYEGSMTYLQTGFAHYPLVPGHEWSGVVAAVGDEVTGFAVGDHVVGECSIGCGHCDRCTSGNYHLCVNRRETGIAGQDGALAEYLLYPARSAHVVPPDVSLQDAALIEPTAIAFRALQQLDAPTGSRIVVVGGGTIGVLACLVATALGLEAALVESNPIRREWAESLGLEVVAGGTVHSNWVLEAAGSDGALRAALDCVTDGGRIVLVGLRGAETTVDLDEIVVRDLTVKGSLGSAGVWPQTIELLASQRLNPSGLVSHRVPFSRSVEAFELAQARNPAVHKVLVLSEESLPSAD